jgi:hypothetical protein
MKSISALMLFVLLGIPAITSAKDKQIPYAEIFGGYSYLNGDIYGLSSDRQHMPGWKVALSTPLNSFLALDYEVAGNYKAIPYATDPDLELPPTVDMAVRNYTIFFGPRISHGPLFAHFMIGGDCMIGRTLGISESQWSLAGAFGGGIQIPATKLLSFRISADYELAKHDLFGYPEKHAGSYVYYQEQLQKNLRLSAGIVFNIGKMK